MRQSGNGRDSSNGLGVIFIVLPIALLFVFIFGVLKV